MKVKHVRRPHRIARVESVAAEGDEAAVRCHTGEDVRCLQSKVSTSTSVSRSVTGSNSVEGTMEQKAVVVVVLESVFPISLITAYTRKLSQNLSCSG